MDLPLRKQTSFVMEDQIIKVDWNKILKEFWNGVKITNRFIVSNFHLLPEL